MSAVVVQHRYYPRKEMARFHARHQRWALIVAHRRYGKTYGVVQDLITRALKTRKPRARYGYVAPTYGQAKNIAWGYIKEATRAIPGIKVSESETSVTLPNGAYIRCYGVDNPDALRGVYFDGIVCDEFAMWEGRAWTEVIRPTLSDRQGWAVFIGTPNGATNKFAKLRERAMAPGSGWFYLELKASETGVLPQAELDEARLEMTEDEYAQEYECSFTAAIRGAYFGKHVDDLDRRGGIKRGAEARALYDATEPVCIAHDPGRDDAWAIWFWQVVNGEFRFIDYFEESGYDVDEIVEVLGNKPYRYETWWVPHDALHRTARSRKSILDVMRENGAPVRKVPNPDGDGGIIKQGVGAVRKVLRTFPVVFDGDRCARGIEALRNYSRKWDPDAGVFGEKPKHDQWSHGADAFRYAALSIQREDIERSLVRATAKANGHTGSSIVVGSLNTPSRWTLNDAFAERERRLRAQQSAGRMRI